MTFVEKLSISDVCGSSGRASKVFDDLMLVSNKDFPGWNVSQIFCQCKWFLQSSQQTFVSVKTYWRHVSSLTSADVFKMSLRHLDQGKYIYLGHTSSSSFDKDDYFYLGHMSLEDIFKTSWSRRIYLAWSYVFKTS